MASVRHPHATSAPVWWQVLPDERNFTGAYRRLSLLAVLPALTTMATFAAVVPRIFSRQC
jgi:hypothetical protein